MSIFNSSNENEVSEIGSGALGPRVGFLDGFANAYEAHRRASSVFGIERAVGDLNDEQNKKLRSVGAIGDMPWESLPGPWGGDPLAVDLARYYEEGTDNEDTVKRFEEYDRYIDGLKTKHPNLDLKNSREMWEKVKNDAVNAETRLANSRTSVGGDIGEFLGGIVATVDPRTDPYNTATLGVGQLGKKIVTKIASQAGFQGATQTVNEITGVQEERRLLGLETGVGDSLQRIAMTAAGGAVLEGAGIFAGKAISRGKRWFNNTPLDPAPPPPGIQIPKTPRTPEEFRLEQQADDLIAGRTRYEDLNVLADPTMRTRLDKARGRSDLDYMTQQLERWDGEAPINIRPEATARMPDEPVKDFVLDDYATLKAMQPASLDAAARKLDPKTFEMYDKLVGRRDELRAAITEANKFQQPKEAISPTERAYLNDAVDDLTARIDDLTDQVESGKLSNRKVKDANAQIAQLMEQRTATMERFKNNDSAGTAAMRQELLDTDIKMRDMHEVVSRAYARARGEWRSPEEQRFSIRRMMRNGDNELAKYLDTAPAAIKPEEKPNMVFSDSLVESAPILRQSAKVEAKMRPEADGLDYANAIVKENIKFMDERLEAFRQNIKSVIKDKKNGEVLIDGTDHKLNLDKDKMMVIDDNGDTRVMSVRQILEEHDDIEAALGATKKCSI